MTIYIVFVFLGISYLLLAVFCIYTIYAVIKGAPFVPSALGTVSKIVQLASLKKTDVLIDLGSGDGRILKKAAPQVKTAIGIEINPLLYYWSRWRLATYKNIVIKRENLWSTPLNDADVLTLFFIAHHMGALKQKILKEMKPGSRVISYGFSFPDWQPVQKDGKVYLYVV